MRRGLLCVCTLLCVCIINVGCGGNRVDGGDGGTPDDGGITLHCTGAAPTLANDVEPILRGCGAAEFCHGLAYSSAANARRFLVGQPTAECADRRLRVAAGDPEHSYLVHKLTDRNLCMGTAMPRGIDGPWHPLPSEKLQTIYDWICAGAN